MHVNPNARRGRDLDRELLQKSLLQTTRHVAHRGNVATAEEKGHSFHQNAASTAQGGIEHGTTGHAQRREATLAPAEGFAVRHSPEDVHTQLRWVATTIATQLPVHPHEKLPHLTHIRTPLWWEILCALWTLIAPRSGTLCEHSFALFPSWRSPLATHRPRASVFTLKNVQRQICQQIRCPHTSRRPGAL